MTSLPTLALQRRNNVRRPSNHSDMLDYSIIDKYASYPYNLNYASIVSKGYINDLNAEHNLDIPWQIIHLTTTYYFVHEHSIFQFAYKISKALDQIKKKTVSLSVIKMVAKCLSTFKFLNEDEISLYFTDLIRLEYIKVLHSTSTNRLSSNDINVKDCYRFGMATTILFDNCSKFRKTLKFQVLRKFFHLNCHFISTPSSLHGVPIKRSPLRRNGLNIISITNPNQTSTLYNPNPNHVLDQNAHLILCGSKIDIHTYLKDEGCAESDTSAEIPSDYYQELMKKYVVCVPAPSPVVGLTLAQIPQLSQSGINLISLNHQIQHPSKLCNTQIKSKDILLCCFSKAQNKRKQLSKVFQTVATH